MWIFRIPEAAACRNSEKYVHVEVTVEGNVAGGNLASVQVPLDGTGVPELVSQPKWHRHLLHLFTQ